MGKTMVFMPLLEIVLAMQPWLERQVLKRNVILPPLMEASGSSSNKASTLQTYGVTELPTDPKGSATPPPPFAHGAITETSPQKGNEISEEHGYAPYCYFSSYM
jgi:hypothetical protein